MRAICGVRETSEEMFISHAYLALLAWLAAWTRLADCAEPLDDARFVELFNGNAFALRDIAAFVEADAFTFGWCR